MSITVKEIYTQFPDFDFEKMKQLTGKSEFEEDDTIQLSRIAGLGDRDLSIWTAKKEGENFVNLVQDENERTKISAAADINTNANKENTLPANIPMDVSVFDIAKNDLA